MKLFFINGVLNTMLKNNEKGEKAMMKYMNYLLLFLVGFSTHTFANEKTIPDTNIMADKSVISFIVMVAAVLIFFIASSKSQKS